MGRRIYKTGEGAMLAGVCAGLAEYLGVDVTLVRLGFVIVSLMNGAGVIGYIIAAIVMPNKWQVYGDERPASRTDGQSGQWTASQASASGGGEPMQDDRQPDYHYAGSPDAQRLFALILIALGGYLLVNRYFDLSYLLRHFLREWWPLVPLLAGAVLLVSSFRKRN